VAYNLVVADSSLAIKKICQTMFPEAAFSLHFVGNLEELNQLLDNLTPEAIILSSTVLDPLESILNLNNKLAASGRIPIFVIGGCFEPLPQEYLQTIKPEKLFLKPFYSESLAEAVRQAIEKHRVPDTLPEELPAGPPAVSRLDSANLPDSLLREVRLLIQEEVLETERELEKRLRSNLLGEIQHLVNQGQDRAQKDKTDKDQKKG